MDQDERQLLEAQVILQMHTISLLYEIARAPANPSPATASNAAERIKETLLDDMTRQCPQVAEMLAGVGPWIRR